MGLFDTLFVDYELPEFPDDFVLDKDLVVIDWQTKNLQCGMSLYKIIREGLLIEKIYLEDGSKRWVPVLLWDTIHFYTSYMVGGSRKWLQYKATFDAGYLVSIEREYIEPFGTIKGCA